MDNEITLTLPDNISFEEIALQWCQVDSDNAIYYVSWNCYRFMKYEDSDYGDDEVIAEFYPHDRKLLIGDSYYKQAQFEFVLDYIRERSNV